MNKLDMSRLVFYFKMAIQVFVLIYVATQIGLNALTIWIIFVALLIVFFNIMQMRLPDEGAWPRIGWKLLEWLFCVTLFPFVQHSPYFILMIVLIVSVVIAFDSLFIRIMLVSLFSLTTIAHRTYLESFDLQETIVFLMLVLFFVVFAYFFSEFEEQKYQLEELNKALRGYAEMEKAWALEQERNRIARDLHDTVAHQSTGLIVQLQKMKMAYELGRDLDVRNSINESEQAARSMLNDMRQSVRMISPVETKESPFEQLFSDYSQLADLEFHHEGIKYLYDLTLSHQADLYGICKEAITNAKRHGNATRVDIKLMKTTTHLSIIIKDNGTGLDSDWKKGYGLEKISERIKNAKGDWDIFSDNGTTVTIKWPLQKGDSHD